MVISDGSPINIKPTSASNEVAINHYKNNEQNFLGIPVCQIFVTFALTKMNWLFIVTKLINPFYQDRMD